MTESSQSISTEIPQSSSVTADDELQESRTAFEIMAEASINENTKKGYLGKIKQMKKWLESKGLSFSIPSTNHKDILAFFGSLTRSKPHPQAVRLSKSALVWFHKKDAIAWDKQLDMKLEKFLRGYKKREAAMRLAGEKNVFEGKHPISFTGYQIVARKFMEMKPEKTDTAIINTWNLMMFGWAWLTLSWNLMARSASVSSIKLQHISWQDDSMVIAIPKSKTDQEGDNCFPRHVYANPLVPSICPILALAVLVFSKSYWHGVKPQEKFHLFPGEKQEARFSKLLRRVLQSLTETESSLLGAKVNEIGTHSTRKGASSYCSGMVGGPSMAQIYLRAGWSLGDVQDRYIFSGNGGDQFTGRVVCGLPNTDLAFRTLPPHFNREFDIDESRWSEILPGYAEYPHAFKQVAVYLLASILYHEAWLRQNISSQHPIFSSYLFQSGYAAEFRKYVVIESDRLPPTGIPTHLTITNELYSISQSVNQSKSEILQQCKEMPKVLTDTMLSKFTVNGAVPVTVDNMKEFFNQMMKEMKNMQREKDSKDSEDGETNGSSTVRTQFNWYTWGGRMHMVPEHFTLPTSNVKDIWNLWWFGHVGDSIQPYRHLESFDFISKSQQIQLTKTRKVMGRIELTARNKKHIEQGKQLKDLNKGESVKLFDLAYRDLLLELLPSAQDGRVGECSIATIYDRINGHGNRKRKRMGESRQSA
jgi:hypothetical protein